MLKCQIFSQLAYHPLQFKFIRFKNVKRAFKIPIFEGTVNETIPKARPKLKNFCEDVFFPLRLITKYRLIPGIR